MIAYVDSSVVLRLTVGQAGLLPEWRRFERGVARTSSRLSAFGRSIASVWMSH